MASYKVPASLSLAPQARSALELGNVAWASVEARRTDGLASWPPGVGFDTVVGCRLNGCDMHEIGHRTLLRQRIDRLERLLIPERAAI